MRFLKLFISLLIFSFPLGEIIRFDLGNNIALKPNDLLVFLSGFGYGLYLLRTKKRPDNFPVKPFLIFSAVCALSLFFNIFSLTFFQFIASFLYLIRWVFYALLIFIIAEFDVEFKKKILKMMMFSGIMTVLIGFIQYFLYSNLRNLYYLGWDEHMYRMFSSFLDPNFAGIFFVLVFIMLLSFFFHRCHSEPKAKNLKILHFVQDDKQKNPSNIEKILFVCLLSITLFSIFLTYSRSALFALVAGTSIVFLLNRQKKMIFLILFFVFSFVAVSLKDSSIENLNLFRIASSEARIDSAKNAIEIIRKNPILGVGFNSYRYAQIRYGFRDIEKTNLNHADAGTDNSFLFVLATTGIIGFLAYSYLIYSILKKSFCVYLSYRNEKLISIITISSFAAVFVSSLFINSLFYSFIMEWLWILAGINMRMNANKNTANLCK